LRPALWVDECAALLGGSHCAYCDRAGAGGAICATCTEALPWNGVQCPGCALPQAAPVLCRVCAAQPRAFDGAWTAFVYAAPVQAGVHGLKYAARFDQGRLLVLPMAQALRRRPQALPDLLLPVPLHRARMFSRGYNQAAELARRIGRELGIGVDPLGVQRLRPTIDQIGQRAAERRRNLQGAFACSRDLSGRHVALIDDVMTTGATLEALARAVRAAGAARIEAWALARVP
jgi:ComF family protein